MPGLGTLINVIAIIAAGLIGLTIGKFLNKKIQDSMIIVCGVSTLFIAISGVLSKMLVVTEDGIGTTGSMMMMLSLIIGTLIGEILKLNDKIETFGEWLKKKTGNAKDQNFVNAFVTASLTVCIGAMAIVGAIEDALLLNPSILIAKSILDFIIIIVMTASMGKGTAFSAIPVAILQGGISLLATFISPVLTTQALNNISMTGSAMIFCVGLNLIFDRKIRVANMLPGLIIAAAWAFIPGLSALIS